ncbi:MAG: hypothetical protein ACLFTT_11255 [Candidatus Hydrogenedentota bacterium]
MGKTTRWSSARTGGLWMAVLLLAASAGAQQGLPGDVNLDGAINVLDVQGSVNMAIGEDGPVQEADVDANAAVDVRDVQAIINTTLGTGGLVQPVAGTLGSRRDAGDYVAVAVSQDGRYAQAAVDPETGGFQLTLGVGTAWSIALVRADPQAESSTPLLFDVAGMESSTIPLLQLATGGPIELGLIIPGDTYALAEDLRELLAQTNEPIDLHDYDDNGLADAVDELVFPLPLSIPIIGFELPPELDVDNLTAKVSQCLDTAYDGAAPLPALTGMEQNGVPDFADPMLHCFEQALNQWLVDAETGLSPSVIDFYVDFVADMIEDELPEWLATFEHPDLTDLNGNYIPDYLEDHLSVPGVFDNGALGINAAGIPYYMQDSTGNGIPNLWDPAAATGDDVDADGVPNDRDIDADNDGVPNYADAEPLNPDVQ